MVLATSSAGAVGPAAAPGAAALGAAAAGAALGSNASGAAPGAAPLAPTGTGVPGSAALTLTGEPAAPAHPAVPSTVNRPPASRATWAFRFTDPPSSLFMFRYGPRPCW